VLLLVIQIIGKGMIVHLPVLIYLRQTRLVKTSNGMPKPLEEVIRESHKAHAA
jgi:hypothetical protein